MLPKENNFAYIDGQNLNLGVQNIGWNLDFKKFRVYLKEKYGVLRAYYFIGFMAGNQPLYDSLQEYGYILNFKPVVLGDDKKPKGNIDADLVLRAMIDLHKNDFNKAIVVTSDGDFYSLVNYLYEQSKLLAVISPNRTKCSSLLRKSGKEKMIYLDNLREKLEYKYKRKSTA
jgi:uncharacterized LabA/DUF88 family protein